MVFQPEAVDFRKSTVQTIHRGDTRTRTRAEDADRAARSQQLVTRPVLPDLAIARTPQLGNNGAMLQPGQNVRVNLAGVQVGSVIFHAAVTDAVGTVVRQTSENPPKYLIKLLFSFRGVDEVEVPETRIVAAKG